MLLGLPRKAGLFWLSVVSVAATVLLVNWPAAVADQSYLPAAVFFAIACGLAERVQVRVGSPRPGGEILASVSCAVLVAVIVLFPLPWAALIAALGFALGGTLRGNVQPLKLSFNIANLTLSVAAGSAIWSLGGNTADLASPMSIVWVAMAALVYFGANTGLTATMVAFVVELPIALMWRRSHANMLVADLALLAVGVPLAGLWLVYPWMLPCLAIGLLALHRAMADRVKLETQTLETLFELADILDDRDKYTHGHSQRVGYYAEQTAVQLGLSGDRAHLAFLAGRLHDIGKCAINNEVLLKPARLDEDEQSHMRKHPEVGSAMLAHFSLFREVATYVRGHHERWDGKGYPDGLRGEDIALEARIIAVVDSYDAMTTTRPYRSAMDHAEAVRRLRSGAGKQWDPRVVATFVGWADEHPSRAPSVELQQPVAA
ncbi:MAG: HD-GYP domain-containing protein [Chloroflexota bacterium]|nr:HD-GYP domain-containing protein [Chloroflexota bacterium]